MPRKKAQFGAGAVNVPGYPSNVRLTPQAVAQLQAQQGQQSVNPVLQQFNAPQPQQQYGAVNPQYNSSQSSQLGPLAGMINFGMPQQNFQQQQPYYAGAPFMQQPGLPIPQANQQNTQLQSHYLDPSRNEPASNKWYDYIRDAFGTIIGLEPKTEYGRWQYDTLWGGPPQTHPSPRFTQYQQNALNYLTQGGLQGLSQTQPNFAPIANQQLERFYTQTIPSIAERFTSMGGGQRSSAFQGALGNAGRFLGNDLAALQGQYNLQQQGNLINMLNLGLTPQYENIIQQGGTGLIPGAAGAAVELGKAAISAGGASTTTDVGKKPNASKA